jgi:hypothetical protein
MERVLMQMIMNVDEVVGTFHKFKLVIKLSIIPR